MPVRGNLIFSGLNDEQIETAIRYFKERSFGAHEVVVAEGEIGDEMFLIQDGSASVKVAGLRVAEVPPEDVFGEVCLIEPGMRTASVIASQDMNAWSIDTATFHRLCHENPAIALRISLNLLRMLGDRLRKADAIIHLNREEIEDLANTGEKNLVDRLLGILNFGKE
jgi:CRP-like cAMP-binding protein